MLQKIPIQKILFIDIETAPVVAGFSELSPRMQELWKKKSSYFRKDEDDTAESLYNRAGIYAEFGKIICISVGHIILRNGERSFRIKSFYDDDEKKLLENFKFVLEKFYKKTDINLCAHNGKEFDFPYIARRMLINRITLPNILNVAGKKPWEVPFLDTLELWKFGDFKNYTSLDLLSEIFNIPSSKDDIDGSMVAKVYWEDNDLPRIVKYCEKDTLVVAQLFLKYRGEETIPPENVQVIS